MTNRFTNNTPNIIKAIALLVASSSPMLAMASDPYSRVTDQEDGTVSLEMCQRTFKPTDGNGPRIHLVSAIHIADQSFYQAMQTLLDGYDTVLFEGVKPAGFDAIDPNTSDLDKAQATRDRLDLLIGIADQFFASTGRLPENFDDLIKNADPQIATMVKSIQVDAWGQPLKTSTVRTSTIVEVDDNVTKEEITKNTIAFTSMGADHKPGGKGVNADIVRTSESYLPTDKRKPAPQGIQGQLAKAMNVSFQLDEMDSSKSNWVNADIDIKELNERLSAQGGDDTMILEMIQGETWQTKMIGMVLNFVSGSPQLSSIMKIVMMDVLAAAETSDIMNQIGPAGDVILHGRNDIVIEYLNEQLENNPNQDDIGIFYGAAHMSGLEETILSMGYEFESNDWAQAMVVDTNKMGIPAAQVQMMRGMLKNTMEQSFEALMESQED